MKHVKLFESFNDSALAKSYQDLINEKRNGLLIKASKNPNYCFLLKNNIQFDCSGEDGKCETNSWSFIKNKLEKGISHFYPVGGYFFQNVSLFPVEHWWVYDKHKDQHIELSPMDTRMDLRCYAGIINYDIQEDIKKSEYFHDVHFFKGGNVYQDYFKN